METIVENLSSKRVQNAKGNIMDSLIALLSPTAKRTATLELAESTWWPKLKREKKCEYRIIGSNVIRSTIRSFK